MTQQSFAPTLAYLQKQHPKWKFREVSDFHSGALASRMKDMGCQNTPFTAQVGIRGIAKRTKGKSYVVIDAWCWQCWYLCTAPGAPEGGIMRRQWEPNDREEFEDIMAQFAQEHRASRKGFLAHQAKLDRRLRREEQLANFERRHAELTPLDRLRLRYR